MSIKPSEKRADVPANDSDRKDEEIPIDSDGLGVAPIIAAPQVNESEASEHIDGGLLAWLQVAGCCFLYWNSLGLINTFGAFQTFYETQLLRESSASAISWVGSIQMFLLLATGPIIGPLYDAGHCRLLLYVGTFLVVFGFMMTSLCTAYWQVILSHAICVGLGAGFLTIPAIAIVPPYFQTKRAQAMTTASIGSCLGGTVYPLIFQELQPRIGFPWTVRILGFLSCAMCCFALAVLRPRHRGQRQLQGVKSLVDRTAFRSAPYCLYSVGVFFSNLAWFVPVFYIQTYALSHGLEGQPVALYLVAIMNAASIPGRILLGILSDVLGPVNTFVFITASTTIVVFSWPAVNTEAGNISFSVFYGFFSGSLVAVAPVVLTSFTKDMKVLGTRLGMVAFLKSIASLTGSPIAGAILGESRNYLGLQLFPGISFTITAAFMVALRSVLAKKELKTKI